MRFKTYSSRVRLLYESERVKPGNVFVKIADDYVIYYSREQFAGSPSHSDKLLTACDCCAAARKYQVCILSIHLRRPAKKGEHVLKTTRKKSYDSGCSKIIEWVDDNDIVCRGSLLLSVQVMKVLRLKSPDVHIVLHMYLAHVIRLPCIYFPPLGIIVSYHTELQQSD